MKRIISIVGARPQFIKLGPISKLLRYDFHEIVVHTGQHYDSNMSDNFFSDLELPHADYNLGMGGGPQGEQTGRMLAGIERVLEIEKPAAVIVFGDTNTTLAAALAAAKLGIKLIHIESGLRSFNRNMPEEVNRVVTDHLADFLFAPTETAVNNLKNEGLSLKTFYTGDIMVESLAFALTREPNLCVRDIFGEDFLLATFHRPYNVDDYMNLSTLISLLGQLDQRILFPIHPRTKKLLDQSGLKLASNIEVLEPLGYIDFTHLMKRSIKVLTDSGGIQKEAFILGKPCITFRTETEWVETVQAGWNFLLDYKSPEALEHIIRFSPSGAQPALFGSDVAQKMAAIIKSEIL